MLARDLAEQIPTVTPETTGAEAARLIAEYRLSAVVVADASGVPTALIPGSQVLALILPSYLDENPNLTHTLDEAAADEWCRRLNDVTIATLLGRRDLTAQRLPSVLPDDTLVEIASVMVRGHLPMICVHEPDGRFLGVVTMSRAMAAIASAAGHDSELVQHRLETDIIRRGESWLGRTSDGELGR